MPDYEPSNPVEGGRVYTETSATELSLQSSNPDSGYYAANELVTAVEDELDDPLRATLAGAGIDVLGFEFLVNPKTDGPAFASLNGAVGLSVFWLTDPASANEAEPHIYLFARQGKSAVEPIGPTPTPSTGTTARFFVAHFGGTATVTADTWMAGLESAGVDAAGDTGGLLDGDFSLFVQSHPILLIGNTSNWYGFTVDLTAEALPEGGVTLTKNDSTYAHDTWLLTRLGLQGRASEGDQSVPPHEFYHTNDGRVPDWNADSGDSTALNRYGGGELYYQLSSQHVQQLQVDLWELGFWFPGMINSGVRTNYSFEPGNQSTLTTTDATGTFGIETEWALREFQLYAKMGTVARHTGVSVPRYVDALEPTANVKPYMGGVHGVLTTETAACLRHWLDNDYRCPVVVEAYENPSNFISDIEGAGSQGDLETAISDHLQYQNIWRRLEVQDTGPRMFVTDFSDYYDVPSPYDSIEPPYEITSGSPDRYVDGPHAPRGYVNLPDVDPSDPSTRPAYILGGYFDYRKSWATYPGGPVSKPAYGHTWPIEGEVLPENLIPAGSDPDPPDISDLVTANDATLSTFKIVRASSEEECEGYFDAINSYDGAIASLGPCHWTLSVTGNRFAGYPASVGSTRNGRWTAVTSSSQKVYGPGGDLEDNAEDELQKGELPAFFAFVRSEYPGAFRRALRFFGLDVATRWGSDGSSLFGSQGKFTGKLSLLYQTAGGSGSLAREPVRRRDADYFRNWHWFYRLVMAGRTIDGFRHAMWDASRIRIRDILNAQWPTAGTRGATNVPTTVDNGTRRRARTGEAFTSERVSGVLLRWHIKGPADVVESSGTGDDVIDAYEAARTARGGWPDDLTDASWNPGNDGNDRESELVTQAVTEANNRTSVNNVRDWPSGWIGWQNNTAEACHYELDVSQLGSASNPQLDDERDSFDFDTTDINADSP